MLTLFKAGASALTRQASRCYRSTLGTTTPKLFFQPGYQASTFSKPDVQLPLDEPKEKSPSTGVYIGDLNKSALLLKLWNSSKPFGLVTFQLTLDDAEEYIRTQQGKIKMGFPGTKVIVFDVSNDSFDTSLYDQYNGPGAAKKVIEEFRKEGYDPEGPSYGLS